MKRRDFLAASAAAAAGSGLVACRPPETSAASPLTSGQWGSGDYSHVPGLAGPAHGTVWGRTGVTACSDYYASLAGTQTMMRGGNAIDAMVAACATLNVSDPYMSGIGGFGGYMLIYVAEENRVVGLDALGRSPGCLIARDDDARRFRHGLQGADRARGLQGMGRRARALRHDEPRRPVRARDPARRRRFRVLEVRRALHAVERGQTEPLPVDDARVLPQRTPPAHGRNHPAAGTCRQHATPRPRGGRRPLQGRTRRPHRRLPGRERRPPHEGRPRRLRGRVEGADPDDLPGIRSARHAPRLLRDVDVPGA